jgi:hypothetical protein
MAEIAGIALAANITQIATDLAGLIGSAVKEYKDAYSKVKYWIQYCGPIEALAVQTQLLCGVAEIIKLPGNCRSNDLPLLGCPRMWHSLYGYTYTLC